jgi:hypothetical protein
MNAKEHLLYQDILKYHNAYDCVLNAFERALRDHNLEAPAEDSERSPEFASGLIAKVFDNLPPETVEEYINLGRKEKIARSIMHFLNNEEYNTNKIQTLLEEFSRIPAGKIFLPTTMTLDIRVNLISHFISNHLAFISIAKNYINMRDIASIIDNSVAVPSTTGMIGGKSGGMLLANRILRPTLSFECPKELEGRIEEIESWYIRSSIINEFIANNQLEECHSLKYIEGDEFDKQYKALSKRFMKGSFSPRTIKRFRSILDKARGCPLILRSSSFLEDSVGCSFSGKYDSFFISNRGSDEERLQEFTARTINCSIIMKKCQCSCRELSDESTANISSRQSALSVFPATPTAGTSALSPKTACCEWSWGWEPVRLTGSGTIIQESCHYPLRISARKSRKEKKSVIPRNTSMCLILKLEK